MCTEHSDPLFSRRLHSTCSVRGGDGLAFVLHRDPAEAEAVGGAGADMGYGGLRDSLAVSMAQLLLYRTRCELNEVLDRSRDGVFGCFLLCFWFWYPALRSYMRGLWGGRGYGAGPPGGRRVPSFPSQSIYNKILWVQHFSLHFSVNTNKRKYGKQIDRLLLTNELSTLVSPALFLYFAYRAGTWCTLLCLERDSSSSVPKRLLGKQPLRITAHLSRPASPICQVELDHRYNPGSDSSDLVYDHVGVHSAGPGGENSALASAELAPPVAWDLADGEHHLVKVLGRLVIPVGLSRHLRSDDT